MNEKGLYFAWRQEDIYGIAFAVVYMKSNRDLQITVHLFDLVLAIGYRF